MWKFNDALREKGLIVNSKEPRNVVNDHVDRLQRERDGLLDLLRKLIDGDVGQQALWKLSEGQGTETADGKTWLAAKAVVDGANSPATWQQEFFIPHQNPNNQNN